MFILQDIYMEIKLRETTADLNLNMVGWLGKVTNTLTGVGQKTYKKDTLWKIKCYVKIILKWVLNKQGKKVWTGVFWLTVWSSVRTSKHHNETSHSINLGCTNSGHQVSKATKWSLFAPNICGSSVWNLLLRPFWHLQFWDGSKIFRNVVDPCNKYQNFMDSCPCT
jgi:hypothetical protein